MKLSSKRLLIILIPISTLLLLSCSHNFCPAYAIDNEEVINEYVKKMDFNRDDVVN